MWKWTKRAVVATAIVGGLGILCFGTDVFSYASSSVKSISDAVKESVPVEFEIRRARDMIDQLIPEMQAHLKVVAQEEVEVAHLEKELDRERQAIEGERVGIRTLREHLTTARISYRFSSRTYTRSQVIEELARRFEHFRTAEQMVAAREKLLLNRRVALDAAIKRLEKMRLARVELAAQIESLQAQFRLVQAQAASSEFHLDDSKLAQTQRMLDGLRKRLEVSQRVLAREARFIETIPVETESEESLLEKIDNHLDSVGSDLVESY